MQTHTISHGADPRSAESVILRELSSASRPLAAAELKKRVTDEVTGLAAKPYTAALELLLAQRAIHCQLVVGKNGKPTKKVESYALGAPPPPPPSPRELAPAAVERALREGPQSAATLKAAVTRLVPGLKGTECSAILGELAASGAIYAKRKRGKDGKPTTTIESYALEGSPASELIEPVITLWNKVRRGASSSGVKESELVAALLNALSRSGVTLSEPKKPPPPDGEAVMGGIHELLKREGRGALIPVRRLRAALALAKERFDQTLLQLYREDKVILHHHDYIGNLTEAERDELVVDQYGNYYVGVALAGDH